MESTSNVVDRDFILHATTLEPVAGEVGLYLVRWRSREYLVKRYGWCDYRSCGAVCCRMICLAGEWNNYLDGFAEKGIRAPVIRKTCWYLSGDLSCSRWNREDFPSLCRNFPLPGDAMYAEVMDKCSFRFEILRPIRRGEYQKGQTG